MEFGGVSTSLKPEDLRGIQKVLLYLSAHGPSETHLQLCCLLLKGLKVRRVFRTPSLRVWGEFWLALLADLESCSNTCQAERLILRCGAGYSPGSEISAEAHCLLSENGLETVLFHPCLAQERAGAVFLAKLHCAERVLDILPMSSDSFLLFRERSLESWKIGPPPEVISSMRYSTDYSVFMSPRSDSLLLVIDGNAVSLSIPGLVPKYSVNVVGPVDTVIWLENGETAIFSGSGAVTNLCVFDGNSGKALWKTRVTHLKRSVIKEEVQHGKVFQECYDDSHDNKHVIVYDIPGRKIVRGRVKAVQERELFLGWHEGSPLHLAFQDENLLLKTAHGFSRILLEDCFSDLFRAVHHAGGSVFAVDVGHDLVIVCTERGVLHRIRLESEETASLCVGRPWLVVGLGRTVRIISIEDLKLLSTTHLPNHFDSIRSAEHLGMGLVEVLDQDHKRFWVYVEEEEEQLGPEVYRMPGFLSNSLVLCRIEDCFLLVSGDYLVALDKHGLHRLFTKGGVAETGRVLCVAHGSIALQTGFNQVSCFSYDGKLQYRMQGHRFFQAGAVTAIQQDNGLSIYNIRSGTAELFIEAAAHVSGMVHHGDGLLLLVKRGYGSCRIVSVSGQLLAKGISTISSDVFHEEVSFESSICEIRSVGDRLLVNTGEQILLYCLVADDWEEPRALCPVDYLERIVHVAGTRDSRFFLCLYNPRDELSWRIVLCRPFENAFSEEIIRTSQHVQCMGLADSTLILFFEDSFQFHDAQTGNLVRRISQNQLDRYPLFREKVAKAMTITMEEREFGIDLSTPRECQDSPLNWFSSVGISKGVHSWGGNDFQEAVVSDETEMLVSYGDGWQLIYRSLLKREEKSE